MSLRQIEGFLAAAQTLSFSRAAAQLHISQPAFSQLIQDLEAAVTVRLFDRTTRRVALTQAGVQLERRMRLGMTELGRACEDARAFARLEKGQLNVATLLSLSVGVVTHALGKLCAIHPGLLVSLTDGSNGPTIQRVVTGEADLAVCAHSDASGELEFEHLFSEELVAVLPHDHPLAQRETISWTALSKAALVLVPAASSTYQQVSRALAASNARISRAHEVSNMFTALTMVRSGFGVTVLPLLVLPEVNMSNMTWRRLRRPMASRQIGFYRRRDRLPSPPVIAFEELFRAQVAAMSTLEGVTVAI